MEKLYKKREFIKKISLFLLFSIIVYFIIMVYSDFNDLLSALKRFDLKFLPIIVILAPLNYFFRYLKWSYYLKRLDCKIKRWDNIKIFLAGLSMTITPGKVGELLKSYLIKTKYAISITRTAPAIMSERLTDGISLLILSLLGITSYKNGAELLIFIVAATLIGILVINNRQLSISFLDYISKLPRLKKFSKQLLQFYESVYTLLTIKSLIIAVVIGLISWTFEGLIIFFALKGLGYEFNVMASIFIVSFSGIIGALSMLPGGLGIAEGSILGILIFMGIPAHIAGITTIITRISTLWLGVLFGILGLISIQYNFLDKAKEELIKGES